MSLLPRQPKIDDLTTVAAAWCTERALARYARIVHDPIAEWRHLERAHVLSQPMPWRHMVTHAAMLRAGVRRGDAREIAGQMWRLAVAGPASLSRRYPLGNTGGANVPAMRPMPIAADLAELVVAS